MIRLTLIATMICYSSISMGCQCIKSMGSNFLSQVDNFDLIVRGTFHLDKGTDEITLEIEEIYNGEVRTKAIELIRGGLDCNHLLSFEDGQRILIGLNKSPYFGHPNGFVAPGCVTSVLLVTNERVAIVDKMQSLPAVGRQRIGLFAKTMTLGTIEKRIKRRLN